MAQDGLTHNWDTPPDGDFVRYIEQLNAASATAATVAAAKASAAADSSERDRSSPRARVAVPVDKATKVQPGAAAVAGSGRQHVTQHAAGPASPSAMRSQMPDFASLQARVWQALRQAGMRRVVRSTLLCLIGLQLLWMALGKGSSGVLVVLVGLWWALQAPKESKKIR